MAGFPVPPDHSPLFTLWLHGVIDSTVGGMEPINSTNSVHVQDSDSAEDSLVTEELLVEEISIDGMCGVY